MKIFSSKAALTASLILLLTQSLLLMQSVYAVESIGHFDDTAWYGLGDSGGYDSIEVDITPDIWNGGNDAYYYSNNAFFSNGNNIYGGIQTNGYDGSKYVGKMAIFSIWNVGSGIAEPSGTAVPFGGEGEGFSVRVPYNWAVGTTYRFRMYIDVDVSSGDRLWGASLTNLSNNEFTRIGRIYAPVAFGKIRDPITFHERYIGGEDSCSQISPSQVSFTNMTANGGSVSSTSWSHYATKTLPECPSANWLKDKTNGYTNGLNTSQSVPPAPAPAPTQPILPPKVVTPPPSPGPVSQNIQTASSKVNDATPTKTKNTSYWIILLPLSLIAAIVGGAYALGYWRIRNRKLLLAKHFPYDFDIHGPKNTKG